ncbi:MAG TPA: ParB/RepB/Spo0J family partition protein [Polyangiaceae bacterium]|jgi:ParB family chromosome partitioning protein
MVEKRRALGLGLDSLLPVSAPKAGYGDKSIFSCPIERIIPQKGQPRQHFAAQALEDLTSSIREHGLLEPLVVRKSGNDKYEIVAGERRWRASQKAGLKEVLVVVKDVSPAKAFELALVENVQREDLNAVELAEALDRMVKELGYTQEELAKRVGKDRTTIANSLRLLKLPARVRQMVVAGALSEGHARALLGETDPKRLDALADRVVRGNLNVRATEALVRESRKGDSKKPGAEATKAASVRDLEARLARALGTKVEVRDRGNKGDVVIPYADLDALDRLLDRLL